MTNAQERLEWALSVLNETAAPGSAVGADRAERETNRLWGAIRMIAELDPDHARSVLPKYVADTRPVIRAEALAGLLLSGAPDARQRVRNVIVEGREDELVLMRAVEVLATAGFTLSAAEEAGVRALRRHPSAAVRLAAVDVVGPQ